MSVLELIPGDIAASSDVIPCECPPGNAPAAAGFQLVLPELHSGVTSVLSLRGCPFCRRARLIVDKESWDLHFESARTIRLPAVAEPECSVTVFTGSFVREAALGGVALVVNCGQQIPTLQVALAQSAWPTQSWSWEISHAVQHRILKTIEISIPAGEWDR